MESAEAKEYTQRAARLRSEGRLEEAVLAARKATTLDPDDANAWWQLALSLRETDEAVISALEKVTELAPDFAPGWNSLGRAYLGAKRRSEALAAYEQGLGADGANIQSMRMVAYLLKGSPDEDAPARRLALLREVFQKDELDEEDTFDLAYLLGEARETAEAVTVYEHYTRVHGGEVAFYNLALGYRTLGRDADALDALCTAHGKGYLSENLTKVSDSVQAKLLALRKEVLKRPQPYLPQTEWFRHYVNPFTLLNVEPADIADNPKALQKAKQALLREIELEDGKVDWLPGLVIDKSTAMARLTELDNEEGWQTHEAVFKNRALNEFIMRGSLEHFLIDADGWSFSPTLPHLLDVGVLERIGPKFAAQYADVLTRAVEQSDLVVVECLMDGRRWVTPAQQDACFESTKRLLKRLSEPLMKVAETADKRPITRAEVERGFNEGSLGRLLALLPVDFYEAHSVVGIALRGLSVSYYNHTHDAEGAKAILAMGRECAQKSPVLAHQMEADERTLDEFIAEEKKNEAHLSFKDRNVSITKSGVVYGSQKLAPTDIIGVRWGLVQTAARPPTHRFTVGFQARRGEDIVVTWTTSSNLEEQQKFWGNLVDATTSYVLDAVATTFQKQLDNGEHTRVGPLEVRKTGVVLTAKGWFSDKQVLVPWSSLSSTLVNGSVVLRDVTNHKATAELPVESTYNAFLLHILANRKDSART